MGKTTKDVSVIFDHTAQAGVKLLEEHDPVEVLTDFSSCLCDA
jgi:hypothetical protein